MNEENKDPKKSWLNQHDSLQEELLSMKDEFFVKEEKGADVKGIPPGPKEEKRAPAHEITTFPKEDPVKVEEEKPSPPPQKEMTIRQMLGGGEPERKEPLPLSVKKEAPPTIPPGTIPKHPELTNYIAKVMQHESKLKRRKFEREKIIKPKAEREDVPRPPIRPKEISRSFEHDRRSEGPPAVSVTDPGPEPRTEAPEEPPTPSIEARKEEEKTKDTAGPEFEEMEEEDLPGADEDEKGRSEPVKELHEIEQDERPEGTGGLLGNLRRLLRRW